MLTEAQFNSTLFHSFTPVKAKLNVKVKELKVRFERSQSIHVWRCLKMPKAFYLQVFFALEYSYYSTEKVKFTVCCFTLFNSKNIGKIVDMQRSDTINKFILQEQLKPTTTI